MKLAETGNHINPGRRALLKAAPAIIAGTTVGALAHPSPEWWPVVTGAKEDGRVEMQMWQDTAITRRLAAPVDQIRNILQRSAPRDVRSVTGIHWRWVDEIPMGIWASGYSYTGPVHYRPEFGWCAPRPVRELSKA